MVPCPSLSSPANPLRGSGVSDRSRCGAVPILERFRRRGEGGGGERGEDLENQMMVKFCDICQNRINVVILFKGREKH